jgi:hypothetical protein
MSKPDDTQDLPWFRRAQKMIIEATGTAADAAATSLESGKSQLRRLDDSFKITDKVKAAGDAVGERARRADSDWRLSERTSAALDATKEFADKAAVVGKSISDESGLSAFITAAGKIAHEHVVDPVGKAIVDCGLDKASDRALNATERLYGAAREGFKPYFPAMDAHGLLRGARRELAYVSACIMQISSNEAEQLAGQFGTAVMAKVAGVATTGALLSLVSTFGAAGTGTAIASLSGAAATNATLAWVGGLVGGGMGAGAVLTGGVSIVVGLAAYRVLASDRRAFESLSELEQRLVQTCWMTIAICDDYLASPVERFGPQDAHVLLTNVFLPLQQDLTKGADELCAPLDVKHAVAFRQHALVDFRRVIVEDFTRYSARESAPVSLDVDFIIGGVIYALMSRSAVDSSIESQLVLAALRRCKSSLEDASESDIGDYLRSLSDDGLRGAAENAKGIYHELLYVQTYNSTHSETYASVFEATNHPGADIEIRDSNTHEVVDQIQLKAVSGTSSVFEHMHRYPDIKVEATDEVAARMFTHGVGSSGFENEALRAKMNADVGAVHDNTLGHRAADTALLSCGIASTKELLAMMRGEAAFPEAVACTLRKVGVATGSSALTAFLFG